MDRDPIGQFIRAHREAKGMNREELCHDICSVTNLSKIELEGRIPRSSVLHQLLERLGEPDTYYTMPLDEYENQIRPLRKKARALVVDFEKATGEERPALREEALSALEKMEKMVEKDDLLTRQRILSDRVTWALRRGPTPRYGSVSCCWRRCSSRSPALTFPGSTTSVTPRKRPRSSTRSPLPTPWRGTEGLPLSSTDSFSATFRRTTNSFPGMPTS